MMADDDEVPPQSTDNMSEGTDTAESKEDVNSTTSTLLGSDLESGSYVALEKSKISALGHEATYTSHRIHLTAWMVVNTLATIGIVFTNKAIFSTPQFRHCQLSFASFHFIVTFLTLHILSRPFIAIFTPQPIRIIRMLPLAIAMCLNVLLMNLSLTFSSVTFYQIARILLTPAVAAINFFFYRVKIPRAAVASLVPMCLGVGLISYYEPKPTAAEAETGSIDVLGVTLALSGVAVSAVYMVWIAAYQRKFEINAFQLLHNQAPIGGILLLAIMPWTDSVPSLSSTSSNLWIMIVISAFCAVLINISQFFIIAGAGPVSSTVAGHVKTCAIVILGWVASGQKVTDRSIFGILLAIASIFMYSMIMLRSKR